jgi:flagellum-specific ATP synthase
MKSLLLMPSIDGLETLLNNTSPYQEVGRVEQVTGLVIEAHGPQAKIGDVCKIYTHESSAEPLLAEVVGFKSGRILMMPFGELGALGPGNRVINTNEAFQVAVGEGLIGRVLDGLGQPIDNRATPLCVDKLAVTADTPPLLSRKMITEQLPLGVRSIDGFMTMGKGQRVGIFAGSGVGKSTTLGMIARNTKADLNVIALIGERGREVREFIEHSLGEEGMKRSIVVVATSDQPAIVKVKAGLVATTIAEYFRDQGKDVVLMLDSLTRVAMALREVGLSIGEPPTSRGYTPSMFAFMPKLLERAGTSETGSITGLYTVLVEGDDFNEPVADTVRGLLDGHIVLTRELAYQNHFPAIDVLASVSRLFTLINSAEHQAAAAKARDLMATYKKSEDIITIGAYSRGSNVKLDMAIQKKEAIDGFLRQGVSENASMEDTLSALLAL